MDDLIFEMTSVGGPNSSQEGGYSFCLAVPVVVGGVGVDVMSVCCCRLCLHRRRLRCCCRRRSSSRFRRP